MHAPQVAMASIETRMQLIPPGPVAASTRVEWTFGDGRFTEGGLSVAHTYEVEGVYELTARLIGAGGETQSFSAPVRVLGLYDGLECISMVALLGPENTERGKEVEFALGQLDQVATERARPPACLSGSVVRWRVNGKLVSEGMSVPLRFEGIGSQEVTAEVITSVSAPEVMFSLKTSVVVTDADAEDPQRCDPSSPERLRYQLPERENVKCGLEGMRWRETRAFRVERCEGQTDGRYRWSEVARGLDVTGEGPCENQSCALPDGAKLTHGASKDFFETSRPASSCQNVKHSRRCENGRLLGLSTATELSCRSGCDGLGVDGSSRIGVVVGTDSVAKTCPFGEVGVFDVTERLADLICRDGVVEQSANRTGAVTAKGQCPRYQWRATGEWSECSAACGGVQTRVFRCVDGEGLDAPSERCGERAESGLLLAADVRECDGAPESVRRVDIRTEQERSSPSLACPRNQIGTVSRVRDVEVRDHFACVDHQVQRVETRREAGAWREERNCRQYVAHRCSHDSLNVPQARGRYEWMLKCRHEIPQIAEFLDQFDQVEMTIGGKKVGLGEGARPLYPTFLNSRTSPEQRWIAPTSAQSSCDIPDGAYVASVCVSSCATPEQPVLIKTNSGQGPLAWMPIREAHDQQMSHVATLSAGAQLESRRLVATRVQQWVTELLEVEQPIIEFTMLSGRVLRVTPNHPMVRTDGQMKQADTFVIGDSLVELGGRTDLIVQIDRRQHFGRVYNVFVESDEPLRNIIVTNGYLNGTGFFQNTDSQTLNRQLFRRQMTKGLLKGEK